MKKIIFIFAAIWLAFFSSRGYAKTIQMIQLDDDTINPITAEYIIGAVERAENERAECLIIKLDTPGGLLNSTRKIVKTIMAADVPVVVYIAPGGSRAGSAGVFITYASHIAAMAPSTNIGAAHPVQLGQKGRETNMWDALKEFFKKDNGERATENEKDTRTSPEERAPGSENKDPMEDKILNDTVAFIKSIAEKRGRNEEWAVASVKDSDSITEQEALDKGVINMIADNDRDLIRKLDGMTVHIGDEDRVLATKDAVMERIVMDGRQQLFNILANPNVAYILMILGFYGLLYEVTHPGIGVPGIAGLIFLILAFFSMQTLPTNYAGLALVVLGLSLFVAEAMVPGLGLLTLGGLVSLILGSLLLFNSTEPMMRVSLSIILPVALTTAAITIFLIKAVFSAHRRKAVSGREGLVGSSGEARADILKGQEGRVFVHGEIWTAVAQEDVASGEKIVVTDVDGLILTVKKRTE